MAMARFGKIEIHQVNGGCIVLFPYDGAVVAAFRETFTQAKWIPNAKRWSVPGKTAFERASAWAKSYIEGEGARRKALVQEAREKFKKIQLVGEFGAAVEVYCQYIDWGNGIHDIRVISPKSEEIISLCRSLNGKFVPSSRAWVIPIEKLDEFIETAAPRIVAIEQEHLEAENIRQFGPIEDRSTRSSRKPLFKGPAVIGFRRKKEEPVTPTE